MTRDCAILREIEMLAAHRREEIRNTPDDPVISGQIYYVSSDGCDENDGRTPDTPWRTLDRVSSAHLIHGDGVLFRRGDIFRGSVTTKSGVTYAAYGTGEKPRFYGWNKSLADPSLWELSDEAHCIWKLTEKILDVGALIFDGGALHTRKLIPSYLNGRFVCRDDESRDFIMAHEMTNDLDIFWYFDAIMTTEPSKGQNFPIPEMSLASYGDLYVRCDRGNPGAVFSEVEALTRRSMFYVGESNDVRIDNICMKYIGLHAVAAGGSLVKGLHVTRCEIGWIGGTIQHYLGTDPNYPQGGRGTVTRYGNGVEIYGGCEDYEVSDCYIYQVYDAGATHQITTNGQKYTLSGIRYLDNLIEYCVYGIEYFLEMNGGDTESYMRDIEMRGNILRLSGFGWGQQRHNTDTPALIKGWSYTNTASDYRIFGNILDRCAYRMLHLVAQKQESCPILQGNTYIQNAGGMLGQYGSNEETEPPILHFDSDIDGIIRNTLGDAAAKVYMID